MWKDYSVGFIKKNRASSLSIMIAAFIASLFLSFLCCMFYNLWVYEVEKIVWEEGGWQGRITGEMDEKDLLTIQNFSNVEHAAINKELSGTQGIVVDLYFHNKRTIFKDMPLITEKLGLEKNAVTYHTLLLSRYLVHDPQDESPPLLLSFYLVILLIVSLSLILIIHNSFAVSMNARIHQFGIFSSIGATPGQIRICLMQEAAVLCLAPILAGVLLGIALSYGAKLGMDIIASYMSGRLDIGFQYHPAIFIVTILASALTVLLSAWLPARKLSRMTPLEAIRGKDPSLLKRKKHSPVLSFLFGMEGELAGDALKAQRKALRTSTLSLTFSFLGFTTMICLFSLTDLSTKYTYFQRYQDAWDVMVTVKDTKIEDFKLTKNLEEIEGIQDLFLYQKVDGFIQVPKETISPELTALGGPVAVAGSAITESENSWRVKAPVVILDDDAFIKYCEQIGIPPQIEGTIILNRIWDSINSVFRYPKHIPFITEGQETVILESAGEKAGVAEVPVAGFTQKVPVLKEEYEHYTLVQFVPVSLWKRIAGQMVDNKCDTYIRILAGDEVTLTELNELEKKITQYLKPSYEIESENRIEDKLTNDNIINGYKLVVGTFCSLLAIIGIANVFSFTSGFLRQRRREFAQYMSAGVTPAGMRKMFLVEALVIAGRPIFITLPLTYFFVEFTSKASYLNTAEVWPEVPVTPIAVFCLAIVGFVALAYYIGGKKVLKYSLADALRDDAMI